MSLTETLREKSIELNVASGLSVGVVRGFLLAISLFALASIVFSGDLAPYLLNGAGMFFFGTAVLSLFLAALGRFPAPVATTPIPVAIVMIAIAESLDVDGQNLYLTFVFAIVGTALLSGVLFFTLGWMKIANFFRFIPFVVSAGALAGSGTLILLMALQLAGLSFDPNTWPALLEPLVLLKWVSSIGFGVCLVLVTRFWKKSYALPLVFLIFCVTFHALLRIFEIPFDDAIEAGIFMQLNWTDSIWPAVAVGDIPSLDWGLIAGQSLNGFVLFLVLLILTVVSFAQLELGANMEFDWNKEFKLHGVANVLSGFCAGIPGATVASASLPNIALRALTPVTSIAISFVLLLFVFFGADILRLMPMPANSGFLISISIPLISDWLLKSRRRLDVPEYSMLLLICAAIVFVGFLEAIALGLILSLAFFAVRLSQVRLVDSKFTLMDKRSRKRRTIPDQAIIRLYANRVTVYRLRGYVFFGSAFSLTNALNESLQSSEKPLSIVLDFNRVTGFDLSALDSLRGHIQRAKANGVKTILSGASERLQQGIERDFAPTILSDIDWTDNGEEALANAEDFLIEFYKDETSRDPNVREAVRREVSPALESELGRQAVFEELAELMSDHVTTVDYADQEIISQIGETPTGMQLLVDGKATVFDSHGERRSQLRSGDAIDGECAIEASAATVTTLADGKCQTLLISPEILNQLERDNNELAIRLYRYILSTPSFIAESA